MDASGFTLRSVWQTRLFCLLGCTSSRGCEIRLRCFRRGRDRCPLSALCVGEHERPSADERLLRIQLRRVLQSRLSSGTACVGFMVFIGVPTASKRPRIQGLTVASQPHCAMLRLIKRGRNGHSPDPRLHATNRASPSIRKKAPEHLPRRLNKRFSESCPRTPGDPVRPWAHPVRPGMLWLGSPAETVFWSS